MDDFAGLNDASNLTAINQNGKRGLEGSDEDQKLPFEDGMKKLKVSENKVEGVTNGSKNLEKKTSKPILAEGQENEDHEAQLMANRW